MGTVALFLAVYLYCVQCQVWRGQPQGQWNSPIGSQGRFGGSPGGQSVFGGDNFGPSVFGGGGIGAGPFGSSGPFGDNNFRSNPGNNWINSGPFGMNGRNAPSGPFGMNGRNAPSGPFGMNGRNAPNGRPFGPSSFGPNGPMSNNPNAWGPSSNLGGPFATASPFLANSQNSQMNSFQSNFQQNPFQMNLNSRSNNPFVPQLGSMLPLQNMPFMPNSGQNGFGTRLFQGIGWQPGMVSLGTTGTSSIGSSLSASDRNDIDISEGETLTCSATDNTGSLAVTLSWTDNTSQRFQTFNPVQGIVNVTSATLSGTFTVLLTRRARVERGCSSVTMGEILSRTTTNSAWGGVRVFSLGVLSSIRVRLGGTSSITIPTTNLPLTSLQQYSGRGIVLCSRTTSDSSGRARCIGNYVYCCKLGYDNQDAILN
ncbi:collagen alpha-1(I) chain-like [Haliotis rubra]|uniref:collagen alpha-1(I) chain-like n=1 Tax=Haliotis rubra TaxID=36100 RepID=UPI001EE62F36|nr:collagen alpha-1(I) chain-like [Haliotis rubra]